MDDAVFMSILGEPATLAGVTVEGIFDTASDIAQGDAIVIAPTFLMLARPVQEGQQLVRQGATYRVRQVLVEPPDGALIRLVLAKVSP